LDTVGSKTTAAWLNQFLEDPEVVNHRSKMPWVSMSNNTRSQIVQLLQTFSADLPKPVYSEGLDGAELYKRGDCRSCHKRDGVGGDRGPLLDGIQEKISKPWLVAYLQNPNSLVANSRMPLFEWKPEEASALATYLVGDGVTIDSAPTRIETDVARAAGLASELGCFQCHRVRKLSLSLDLPNRGSAAGYIGFHAKDNARIKVDLTSVQVESMTAALFAVNDRGLSDADFLNGFWETPIPLQGLAPVDHDSSSSDLKPKACATCHTKQHNEWRTSLHAKAMGPGVIGQLADQAFSNPSFVGNCQTCHAPNAEQYGSLPTKGGFEVNYQFDEDLRQKGVTCMGCHVRKHVRFGPPISEQPPASVWAGPAHGGALETTAHQSASFCSSCHQFGDDDRRLNGKLVQDTYNEWETSPSAQQGQTCQTCHMPGRSHRWLGIHDQETVAAAVTVDVEVLETDRDSVAVKIQVRNVGAGHHLPTYVTPKIFVTAELTEPSGKPLLSSVDTRVIGREVGLNLSREVYDTRIPSGGDWTWRYATSRLANASSVSTKLEVFPDHFYARFFSVYDSAPLTPESSTAISLARDNANTSSYVIHDAITPLQFVSDK
jgi:mono/diheme cytochrome c family protein